VKLHVKISILYDEGTNSDSMTVLGLGWIIVML